MTYSALKGAGNFGTLQMLVEVQLVIQQISSGQKYGYSYTVEITPQTQSKPASFRIYATPLVYDETGVRSLKYFLFQDI